MKRKTPYFTVKKSKFGGKIAVVSVLQFIYNIFLLGASSAIYYLFVRESLRGFDQAVAPDVPTAVSAFFLITVSISILGIAGAAGIRRRHLWARKILLIVSFLELPYLGIGTIIGIYSLRILQSESANEFFGLKKRESRFYAVLEKLEKKKKLVKGMRVAYISLFIFGGIICFGPLFLHILLQDTVISVQMPFGELKGIVVDRAGNIYCVSTFYSNVQVYDENGDFIRTHFIAAGNESFGIMIDENNLLNIATEKTDINYVYSDDGVLMDKIEGEGEILYSEIRGLGTHTCMDKNRNIYTIKGYWVNPYVLKTSPMGRTQKIVTVPFYLWIIMAPFPAILFLFLGFGILMLYEMIS